jgi:hypothetical protein
MNRMNRSTFTTINPRPNDEARDRGNDPRRLAVQCEDIALRTAKFLSFLALVLGSLGLAACGGSDNRSTALAPGIPSSPPASPAVPPIPPVLPPAPSSPFPAPTSPSPYYLAAVGGGPVGGQVISLYGGPPIRVGHLVVVDPASPTTPVALEAATHWHALAEFKEGVIDTSANSVSNPTTRFLVYLKSNRVHRLDLRRGTWPPAPAPVSSLMVSAAAGCGGAAIHDVRNAERSWIVLTGCATTPIRHQWAVRSDMSAADPPIPVASEVVGAMRASDGAITGFVVRDGTRIYKVDAGFGDAIDLFTVAAGTSTRFPLQNLDVPSSMLRGHLLFVEANQLRAYDLTTGSGPVTLFSPGPGELCCSVVASDAANVYVTVGGDNRSRLLKVSAALAVQVLATESASRILAASATPTRLVYSIVDATGVVYRSVPKSGGTPLSIAPAEPCPDLSSVHVAGENIWYDCSALGYWDYGGFLDPPRGLPLRPFVGVVRSDGVPVQIFEHAWIAGTASANPAPLVPNASTIHAVTVAHPEALRAYEGATGTQLVEYAVALPPNLGLEGQNNSAWRLPSLFTALYAEGGFLHQRELFYFQTDAAGVTRVTSFAP